MNELRARLDGRTLGPVRFETVGSQLEAHTLDCVVTVSSEPDMIRFSASSQVSQEASAGAVGDQLLHELRRVERGLSGLPHFDFDRPTGTITINYWVDEASSLAQIATAARSTAALSLLGLGIADELGKKLELEMELQQLSTQLSASDAALHSQPSPPAPGSSTVVGSQPPPPPPQPTDGGWWG